MGSNLFSFLFFSLLFAYCVGGQILYFGGTRVLFTKCAIGIPIVYFEKIRVFKAGVFAT